MKIRSQSLTFQCQPFSDVILSELLSSHQIERGAFPFTDYLYN